MFPRFPRPISWPRWIPWPKLQVRFSQTTRPPSSAHWPMPGVADEGRTTPLAKLLREFFADHLPRVRSVSPNNVHSYRDALALLLRFLAIRHQRPVIHLNFSDLGPDNVLAFLDRLELTSGNGPITRNSRLAAIHAFARYAAAGDPEHLERCQRLLGEAGCCQECRSLLSLRRAGHLFRKTALRAAMSSSFSASRRLSWAFSRSSYRMCLTSETSTPPYFLRQR